MNLRHWKSVIHSHHVYKDIWTPFVGEILNVQQEVHNAEDHFAVAVVKNEMIIGHVPREVSHLFWYFIEQDGTITCDITGHRKHGIGLEVPCAYNLAFGHVRLSAMISNK